MLSEMISIKAVTIICLDERQPIFEMLSDRKFAVVHMIEDSELHVSFLPVPLSPRIRPFINLLVYTFWDKGRRASCPCRRRWRNEGYRSRKPLPMKYAPTMIATTMIASGATASIATEP